ncbi:OmpW/AlkL family protein [Psychroserpens ponticola]|uniref:Outer membrane beta-barrel protein n=1 Tax=Psychroserpens ponticola TaxID=2932268 RepID=A0ABY7RXQ0_9FLAO|nr:OmpW family outer membrane protein [Psychroserpens ponticola]WCO00480.1 outer membrane beta-barrel protein [Psychroserpens ponticola]
MKKIIFSAILACIFTFNTQAQEETTSNQDDTASNDDYSKWQARVRAIYIAPSPYNRHNGINNVDVNFSSTYAPEVDITYFLTKNFSAELMLTTSKHNIEIDEGSDLGSVSMIPLNINFQYHFYFGKFKPYFATGMVYSIFYGEDAGDLESLEFESALGHSLQLGADYSINDKWFINLDLKKMFLKTDITANNDNSNKVEVNVDPILVGLGVGMRF